MVHNRLRGFLKRRRSSEGPQYEVVGRYGGLILIKELRATEGRVKTFEVHHDDRLAMLQRAQKGANGYYIIRCGRTQCRLRFRLANEKGFFWDGRIFRIKEIKPSDPLFAEMQGAKPPGRWVFSGPEQMPKPVIQGAQMVTLNSIGGLELRQTRPPMDTGSPILICVVRNEELILPRFIEHYRNLGVKNFVFIDNDSEDSTANILAHLNENVNDIAVYHTEEVYRDAHSGIDWVNAVIEHVGAQSRGWFLVVDADEFLIYPDYEQKTIDELVMTLSEGGRDAMFTLLLDVYSDKTFKDYETISIDEMRFYDGDGYRVREAGRFPFVQVFGGPRARLFGSSEFSLKKAALFRSDGTTKLAVGAHALTGRLKLASQTGLLLHYKFNADWMKKVQAEAASSRRTQVKQYNTFYKQMIGSDQSFFDTNVSREAASSAETSAGHLMVDQRSNGTSTVSFQTIGLMTRVLSRANQVALAEVGSTPRPDTMPPLVSAPEPELMPEAAKEEAVQN